MEDMGEIYKPRQEHEHEHEHEHELDTTKQEDAFHGGNAHWTQEQTQSINQNQGDPTMLRGSSIHGPSALTKSFILFKSTHEQLEALGPSFSLNLFPNGFTIENTEKVFDNVPEYLTPYNMHTESILSCVECGRLPVGILNDMPCKYVNGTVLCEIRDYRTNINFPLIDKVPLKMGLENIIEDISSMSDKFTPSEQLRFESIVLKFLHPFLNLDPNPNLGGLQETIPMAKIDLGIDYGRKGKEMNTESIDDIGSQTSNMDVLEDESCEESARE